MFLLCAIKYVIFVLVSEYREKKSIMKIDRSFVLREIAGEYIIIPTGKTALEFNGLITVNEIGMELWKML